MMDEALRVAIVHERFTELGGSEQVVARLQGLWPATTVHVPIADRRALPDGLDERSLHTSWLQRLKRDGPRYAHLLPLLPLGMRALRFEPLDAVIASHHAFANRCRPPLGAAFISYTHTPARWMWDSSKRRYEIGGWPGRASLAAFAATQRRADVTAAGRLDRVVVTSRAVADRVRAWWGRDSTVVAPPVDVDYFGLDDSVEREDFFLLAGRLVPYKRPEVAVAAAERAGVRLVVAGDGRSRGAVEAVARGYTEILGSVDRPKLRRLYQSCRALLFPGEEDFGIVPVEAQACGTPVIGLGCGGLLDSVIPGATGHLYLPAGDEVLVLAKILASFDPNIFDRPRIREHAEAFSAERFDCRMRDIVADTVAQVRQRR